MADQQPVRMGEVVKLKCGGPPMVIVYTSREAYKVPHLPGEDDLEANIAMCVWHDANGHHQTQRYPLFVLMRV